ncbi:MAG: diguanylate cyclase [Deltaproteobacteria bacterium]|nr:diguanylate cyclase [Deltaproteobacteria bacterium]
MSGTTTQEIMQFIDVPKVDRVLVVDEDLASLGSMCEMLSSIGFEPIPVRNAGEARLSLAREEFPIVLLDYILPDADGIELVKEIRKNHLETYVLIVTARGSERVAVESLRAGAADYLIKPMISTEVLREVMEKVIRLREAEQRNKLLVKRLAEANRTLEQKVQERTNELLEKNRILEDLSRRDQLTGLINQRYMLERLQYEIFRIERYERPLCFAMIDLDNLKEINDTLLDHQAGSTALKVFADLLRTAVRRTDIAARYGGDEFALILVETEIEEGFQIIERVRTVLDSTEIVYNQTSFRITASAGMAPYERTLTVADLIRRADRALYRAKHQGRNRSCLFDPRLDGT